jgi:hypothetical protein
MRKRNQKRAQGLSSEICADLVDDLGLAENGLFRRKTASDARLDRRLSRLPVGASAFTALSGPSVDAQERRFSTQLNRKLFSLRPYVAIALNRFSFGREHVGVAASK